MPVKITRKYLNLSLDELTLGNGAFTLPTTDGTAGQALVTDGLGQVTFQDVSFSVTTNEIAYGDALNLVTSDPNFTREQDVSFTSKVSFSSGLDAYINQTETFEFGGNIIPGVGFSIFDPTSPIGKQIVSGVFDPSPFGGTGLLSFTGSQNNLGDTYIGLDTNGSLFGNPGPTIFISNSDNLNYLYRIELNSDGIDLSWDDTGTSYGITIDASGVTVNDAYILPDSDGAAGEVLTTDGLGNVSFQPAGGGIALELYDENPSTPTANVVSGANSVAIGQNNSVSSNDSIASGGSGNQLILGSDYSAIGGGLTNCIESTYSTISGGCLNVLLVGSDYSAIGGGVKNCINAGFSNISGGTNNVVSATNSFIGGGVQNTASSKGTHQVISGGFGNLIGSSYSVIGGGFCNQLFGSLCSTIGGGNLNSISNAPGSTISGGVSNVIQSDSSSILGGRSNTINSVESVIGGGTGNIIQSASSNSSILGGANNDTCSYTNSHIIGSNICAIDSDATFVNSLYIMDQPSKSNSGRALVRESNGEVRLSERFNTGFYAQTADGTAITSGATETSLIGAGQGDLSVPAEGFAAGDSFSLVMGGRISTAGGSETIRIRVKADNGVTTFDLANSGVQTLPNATNEAFDLRVNFTIRTIGAATIASITSMSSFMVQKSSSGTLEGFEFNNIESTNFDTTLINTLDITAEWGGAGNSIQSQYFTLTKIY
jgi:hypothetical protein